MRSLSFSPLVLFFFFLVFVGAEDTICSNHGCCNTMNGCCMTDSMTYCVQNDCYDSRSVRFASADGRAYEKSCVVAAADGCTYQHMLATTNGNLSFEFGISPLIGEEHTICVTGLGCCNTYQKRCILPEGSYQATFYPADTVCEGNGASISFIGIKMNGFVGVCLAGNAQKYYQIVYMNTYGNPWNDWISVCPIGKKSSLFSKYQMVNSTST